MDATFLGISLNFLIDRIQKGVRYIEFIESENAGMLVLMISRGCSNFRKL